jgi:hypothetical protein
LERAAGTDAELRLGDRNVDLALVHEEAEVHRPRVLLVLVTARWDLHHTSAEERERD